MNMTEIIKTKLGVLNPSKLIIINDTDKHKGHAGHRDGRDSHFTVIVVSDEFNGKTRIERHKMISAQLKVELAKDIHALSIKAYTGDEYEDRGL